MAAMKKQTQSRLVGRATVEETNGQSQIDGERVHGWSVVGERIGGRSKIRHAGS